MKTKRINMNRVSLKSIAYTIVCVSIVTIVYMSSCTRKNQILDLPAVVTNQSDLLCMKTTTAPTIDGMMDDIWEKTTPLTAITQVPDPGNGLFYGYIGTQYPVTLRTMYDATSIYFLAEIPDMTKSVLTSPWYFDPVTKRWSQEPSARTFDVNGNLTREGWGEDKLAFLWNIDNSVTKFATQTCYASCHLFTPYLDPTTTPATMKSNQSGNHYTNGSTEKIDMWWLQLGKDPIYNQFSDEYQDWAGGPSITALVGGSGNGRKKDDQVVIGASATYPYGPSYSSTVGGTTSNTQKLNLTGVTPAVSVSVPLYVIPGKMNYYYILQTEVASNVAKKVIAVDSTGILTLSDSTKINPITDVDYQRNAWEDIVYGKDGAKIIPSYLSAPLTNGRADITCQVEYTGSGWRVEWKRLLKTPSSLKQDIDFTKGMVDGQMQDQPFGMAFFNQSNYQHGIKPNLLLKFQK